MKKLVITCLLALVVLPAAAWSASTLPNPGFEGGFTNGVADGWAKYTASGGSAITPSLSTTYAHTGTQSQKIDATNGGIGGVYATLDTVVGQTYNISVWVKALKGTTHTSGMCYLAIHKSGSTGSVLPDGGDDIDWVANTGNTNGAWEQLTWENTATTSKTTVALYAYQGVTAYFDDFEPAAAPVPEPSSVLALGTGLVGLAGFVIRRRK